MIYEITNLFYILTNIFYKSIATNNIISTINPLILYKDSTMIY